MRIGGRRRAVNGITAGAGPHEHHTHAVSLSAVESLEFAMIEGVLPQNSDNGTDDLLVSHGAVLGLVLVNPMRGVLVVLATQSHDDVRHRAAHPVVIRFAALFERLKIGQTVFLEALGLGAKSL